MCHVTTNGYHQRDYRVTSRDFESIRGQLHHTDDTKLKISVSRKGTHQTVETKNKISITKSYPYRITNLITGEVREFETLHCDEAALFLGYKSGSCASVVSTALRRGDGIIKKGRAGRY